MRGVTLATLGSVRSRRVKRRQEFSKSPVKVEFDPKFKLPSTGCGCAEVEEDDTSQWEREGGEGGLEVTVLTVILTAQEEEQEECAG